MRCHIHFLVGILSILFLSILAGMRTLCLSHNARHRSTSVGGRLAWIDITS